MIYVDLLVIEDLVLNYTISLGVSIILNRLTNLKKIFLSSVIGTISLIFLFININKYILTIISIIFSILMSIISFNYKNIIYTIKNVIYMYFLSVFLGGSIYLINTSYLSKMDNHLLNFVILTLLSPIITYIYIKNIKNIKNNNSNYYKVDIYLKDKPKITVISFLDTGNKLIDPYTNKPIILICQKYIDIKNEKILLVPYNTIDSHGLLKCILPEKIYIDKIGYIKKVLIGIIDEVAIEGAECILNQALIERKIIK